MSDAAPTGSGHSPRAAILLTGSELTRGETKDANGPFLATELTLLGVRVAEVSLLPDDPDWLATTIERTCREREIVLLSGGLGPTADDHTVAVMARVFGRPIVRHEESAARMRARALRRLKDERAIPANYFKQAEVIEGAEVLLNPVGLAPGMLMPTARGAVVVLPGVPSELQAMFREVVVPRLRERFPLASPRILRAKIFGHGESWAESRIQGLGIDFARVEYGISAKPGELLVKFVAHTHDDHLYLDTVRARLVEAFGDEVLFVPEGLATSAEEAARLEHSRLVHDTLLSSGLTVATAESCTGGLIAKRLTDHGGSSAYLLGGVVAYANRIKESVLDVSPDLLASHGAVSEEVCGAMAAGARRLFGADIAVATTGVAGPGGGSEAKPVGLVYVGLASAGATGPDEVRVEEHRLWGPRESVRAMAAIRGLEMLRRHVASAR